MSTGDSALLNRWLEAMKRGDLHAAWLESEKALVARQHAACDQKDRPLHLRDVWNGEPFAGRDVLVRCHHGLGDTLQFLRYLGPLRTEARSISIKIQPELRPFVSNIDSRPLEEEDPPFQVDLEIMELPFALREKVPHILAPLSYLEARKEEREWVRRNLASLSGPRIGFAWAAGNFIPERSLDYRALNRLMRVLSEIPALNLFSLQRGARAQIPEKSFTWGIEAPAQIENTAALIAELDCVITVDTMIAHLAGALGKPVWILLRENCDWRWMQKREDSPWYPSARLFRQDREGNWDAALDKVQAALRELCDGKRA